MKKSTFLTLTVVTVVVIIAAAIIVYQRAPQTELDKAILFPELMPNINDVARVEVRTRNAGVTLTQQGDGWVIENSGGYPALFEKVKASIVGMAQLRVLEGKTRNPSLYSRLGVKDVDDEDSKSILITLKDREGKIMGSIIVGKDRLTRTGTGPPALYVRKADTPQALLVEGDLDIDATVTSWLNPDIVDIASGRVREVTVEHPDGNQVTISRASTDEKDYTLTDIPDGMKLKSQVALNSLATALEEFRLDDVDARSNLPPASESVVTTVMTFDGFIATITTRDVDTKSYSTFEFAFDESAVPAIEADDVPASEGDISAAPKGPGKNTEVPNEEKTRHRLKSKEEVEQEVATLNEVLSDWAFVIPEFKIAILTKHLDDLIKPLESEAKSESLVLPQQ